MARPTKERRVEFIPEIKYFKPAGIPMRDIEEVSLTIEEVEAIRLKDIEFLNQEEAAGRMNVSRATFQRVLTEARKKVAEALIMGKGIRFRGGDYKLAEYLDCPKCGEKFRVRFHGRYGHGARRRYCPDCEE
ncbi:MAG: DUF134 domain-containing protein [Halanaerobiaceae bacterium]